MLRKDVQVGKTYLMNHTSGKINVRILREFESRSYGRDARSMTHWEAKNLKTGRNIEIKSAAKLLREVTE